MSTTTTVIAAVLGACLLLLLVGMFRTPAKSAGESRKDGAPDESAPSAPGTTSADLASNFPAQAPVGTGKVPGSVPPPAPEQDTFLAAQQIASFYSEKKPEKHDDGAADHGFRTDF